MWVRGRQFPCECVSSAFPSYKFPHTSLHKDEGHGQGTGSGEHGTGNTDTEAPNAFHSRQWGKCQVNASSDGNNNDCKDIAHPQDSKHTHQPPTTHNPPPTSFCHPLHLMTALTASFAWRKGKRHRKPKITHPKKKIQLENTFYLGHYYLRFKKLWRGCY